MTANTELREDLIAKADAIRTAIEETKGQITKAEQQLIRWEKDLVDINTCLAAINRKKELPCQRTE